MLVDEANQVIYTARGNIDLKGVADWTSVKNVIRKELKNLFYKKTRRNPMVIPVIMEN
jgi:ribonuclease J